MSSFTLNNTTSVCMDIDLMDTRPDGPSDSSLYTSPQLHQELQFAFQRMGIDTNTLHPDLLAALCRLSSSQLHNALTQEVIDSFSHLKISDPSSELQAALMEDYILKFSCLNVSSPPELETTTEFGLMDWQYDGHHEQEANTCSGVNPFAEYSKRLQEEMDSTAAASSKRRGCENVDSRRYRKSARVPVDGEPMDIETRPDFQQPRAYNKHHGRRGAKSSKPRGPHQQARVVSNGHKDNASPKNPFSQDQPRSQKRRNNKRRSKASANKPHYN
ncbi:hypothetical protein CTRI78_v009614 [Colletotrichum trifolii]|uniref:Uncharacterized protein n=1 Tax=Colletotrichum trifolii TaxID=5466 RepID=A0A4V3HTU8_COLTR|nr:hypothetical protein CTRI78_v009614 [Colletotrichum trifolii]